MVKDSRLSGNLNSRSQHRRVKAVQNGKKSVELLAVVASVSSNSKWQSRERILALYSSRMRHLVTFLSPFSHEVFSQKERHQSVAITVLGSWSRHIVVQLPSIQIDSPNNCELHEENWSRRRRTPRRKRKRKARKKRVPRNSSC